MNEAGQMKRNVAEKLIDRVPDESIKEQVKSRFNELEDALSKSTDSCNSGKIVQTFGPIVTAFEMILHSGE